MMLGGLVGQLLSGKNKNTMPLSGGNPMPPHIVDTNIAPQPPMGATAGSLDQARAQDKMRMRRQYGM